MNSFKHLLYSLLVAGVATTAPVVIAGDMAGDKEQREKKEHKDGEIPYTVEKIPYSVEVKEKNGISYVEGGIGDTQQRRVDELSGNYSLQLTFATDTGKYLSGVGVSISKSDGDQVVELNTDGPMVNVDLAPGKYDVVLKPVEFSGETKRYSVDISETPTTVNATWSH